MLELPDAGGGTIKDSINEAAVFGMFGLLGSANVNSVPNTSNEYYISFTDTATTYNVTFTQETTCEVLIIGGGGGGAGTTGGSGGNGGPGLVIISCW